LSATTNAGEVLGSSSGDPAAEEAPAAPKKEDDNVNGEDKPSEKEDVKMEDAEGHQSTNGDGSADGTSKEATEEATEKAAEEVDDAETKKDDTTDPPAASAKSGGKSSSTRKKRAAPSSPDPAAASSPSPAGAEPGGGGREKRARKTLVAYAPEDFTKVDRSVQIHPGRGAKIGSIKAVRANIEANKDVALADLAHKLLFGGNKKPPKDAVRGNIFEFSGYLPPKPKDATEKELEAMDKKLEVRWVLLCREWLHTLVMNVGRHSTPVANSLISHWFLQAKMGEKAFNLKVGELRDLCDFFALDRSGIRDKADLIDRLLDFLSAPSAEHVKGSKAAKASSTSTRKGGSSKKKKDDSSEEESEEEDEDQDEEKPKKGKDKDADLLKVEKGKVPNDDALRAWVKCFVQCYDLEKASIKVALQVARDKFGVDLGDKKDLLKEMLAEAMG
jgi:hypothetical protein